MSLLIFYSHYDPLLHLTQDSYKDSVSKLAVVTVRLLVVLSGVDMNHPAIQNIHMQIFMLWPLWPGP